MDTATITPAWWPKAAEQWSEADRSLLSRLDPQRLPGHVAIIMDGNGRWARAHGLPDRISGHEAGIEAVRAVTRTCAELGIRILTLYAFSKENWARPAAEVGALMSLLSRFLVAERHVLEEKDIQLRTIGRIEDLPPDAQGALKETVSLTTQNRRMILNIALSYGGRDEIIRAARELGEQVRRGRIAPHQIDEARFSGLLDTAGLPDPDLLVRTSGEMRVSNFLLWQIAYAEIHVTPVLWPDFGRGPFLEALIDYQGRERRYGLVLDPETS